MQRRLRNRGGSVPFAATLSIIVGLLWSGAIDAEMKWTATMFGLALMTSSPSVKVQARLLRSIKIPPGPFRPRRKVLKLPWPCPGYYGVMVRRPGALASPGPPLLHIGWGVGRVLTSGSLRPREHPRPRLGTRGGYHRHGRRDACGAGRRGGRCARLRGAGNADDQEVAR